MPVTASQTRRSPAERALAWLFTGPPGHLYSVAVDVAVFGVRTLAQRSRRWVRRTLAR